MMPEHIRPRRFQDGSGGASFFVKGFGMEEIEFEETAWEITNKLLGYWERCADLDEFKRLLDEASHEAIRWAEGPEEGSL